MGSKPSVSILSLTAATGTPNCTILKNRINLGSSQAFGPALDDLGAASSVTCFSCFSAVGTTSGKSKLSSVAFSSTGDASFLLSKEGMDDNCKADAEVSVDSAL